MNLKNIRSKYTEIAKFEDSRLALIESVHGTCKNSHAQKRHLIMNAANKKVQKDWNIIK